MHLPAPSSNLSSLLCLAKINRSFPFILSCNAIAWLLNLATYAHLTVMGFISLLIMTVSEYGLYLKLWLPLSFSSPSKLSL